MFNAISFCKAYSIPYDKPNSRGWLPVHCPFCQVKDFHGGIHQRKAYFYCWKCGSHFLDQYISKVLVVSRQEAEALILEHSTRGEVLSHLNSEKHLKGSPRELIMPGEPLNGMYKAYLRKRGFDPDWIEKKYEVKGTGIAGYFKYRLMIPVFYEKKLVTFLGRDITNKQELRYKNLDIKESVIPIKETLYAFDGVKGAICGVVEGVFDQWRLGDGFVATYGTSVTEQQIKLLSRFKKVFFLFDPELEAQRQAKKLAVKLSALGVATEIIDTELDHDPGDFTKQEIKWIKQEIGYC
jgi:hypothetical protein